jgi:hypothetical protein
LSRPVEVIVGCTPLTVVAVPSGGPGVRGPPGEPPPGNPAEGPPGDPGAPGKPDGGIDMNGIAVPDSPGNGIGTSGGIESAVSVIGGAAMKDRIGMTEMLSVNSDIGVVGVSAVGVSAVGVSAVGVGATGVGVTGFGVTGGGACSSEVVTEGGVDVAVSCDGNKDKNKVLKGGMRAEVVPGVGSGRGVFVGRVEGVSEGDDVGDVVGAIIDVVGEGVEGEEEEEGGERERVGNEMNIDCSESIEIRVLVIGKI